MSLRVIEGGKEPGKPVATRRLFFGAGLPPDTREEAARLMESFGIPENQVRWVRKENLHITLKFLGDTPVDQIPAICEAANQVACAYSEIKIEISGLGVFPNHEKPRVVWFGAEGEVDKLAELERDLSDALAPLGFPRDERRYTPHITIGRVKNDVARGKVVRLIREHHNDKIGDASIGSISLYESSLKPAGPVYAVVEAFHLGVVEY